MSKLALIAPSLSSLPLAEATRLRALDEFFKSLPERGSVECVRSAAAGFDYSADGFVKAYYKWKRSGLEGLLDKRRRPAARAASKCLPEIVTRFCTLVGQNQRKDAPGYRALKAELMSGGMNEREIPSLASLRVAARKVWINESAEKALLRHGRMEAAPYLPQVFSTRVGLWPGSHIMIDDVWHDFFVRICRGEKLYSQVRPLELGMLDVFSGCRFHYGIRPRLPNADGTFDQLKEAETRFLVAGWLASTGYSPRGTTILAEHGTAAIRDRVEALLHDRTHGLLRIDRSGIVGNEAVVAGMFAGAGKGNFKFKSALESLHNLIHNETASLPAQAGMNRDSRPEATNTQLSYTDDVTNLALALGPEVLEQLVLPILDWHGQFLPMMHRIHQRINERTWHNLEGWAKCGHVVTEYLLSGEMARSLGLATDGRDAWIGPEQYLQLPGQIRSVLSMMAKADPYTHTRRAALSPQSVFNKGRGEFIRMSDEHIAEILTLHGDLTTEHFRERPVQAGYLTLWDMTKDSGELRYESVLTTPDGAQRELPTSAKFLVCVNPFNLQRAWLFNAKGAFVGTVPRALRLSRLDPAAAKIEMGHVKHRIAVQMDGLRDRHADEATATQAMRDHNARVIADAQGTRPKPKAKAATPRSLLPAAPGPAIASILQAKRKPHQNEDGF